MWVKQTKRVTSWMISLELSPGDPQSQDFLLDDAVMPEEYSHRVWIFKPDRPELPRLLFSF